MLWTKLVAVMALAPSVLAVPSNQRRDLGDGAHHRHGHQHQRRDTTTSSTTFARRPLSKVTTGPASVTTTPSTTPSTTSSSTTSSSSTSSSTTSSSTTPSTTASATSSTTFSRRPLSKVSETQTTVPSTTASTTSSSSTSSSTTSSSTTKSSSTTSSTTKSSSTTSSTTKSSSTTSSSSSTSSTTSSSSTTTSIATTVSGPNAVTTVDNATGTPTPYPDQYTYYHGTGTAGEGWPTIDMWVSFDTMWSRVSSAIGAYCTNAFKVANNSPDETQAVYNAIQAIAAQSNVDHRFILATIMQESSGCVRVPTTQSPDGTVTNPGLMQDYNGVASCNRNGVITNPCPASTIQQMISEGTMGTPNYGLVQDIQGQSQAGYVGAQAIYRAARVYNSGSVPADGVLEDPGATRCYCSDIANRLVGWVRAGSTCPYR